MFLNFNKLRTLFRRGVVSVLKEKLLTKACMWVPYHLEYRPTGVQDVHAADGSVAVDVVEPSCVSECVVPQAFFDVMLNKGYDRTAITSDGVHMRSESSDGLVAKIANGRVYADNLKTSAIITSTQQLLSEVSFQYVGESTSEANSSIFKQRFFKTPERVEGNVFVMLAGGLSGRGNYYHWLIDVLPRLYLLSKSRFSDSVDQYLVPQYDRDFQKTTLRLMGVRADQIIECTPFTHIVCDHIIVASHPRGRRSLLVPDWIFDFYKTLKQDVLVPGDYPKRLYVTRKDTSLRGIEDEDRLIDFLSKYGFVPVTLSEYDFDGKVNLFDAAECVVSAHGAGLTNLLFSNPGSQLLELFSEGFVDPVLLNLAERNQVEYRYLIFKNPNAGFEDASGQYEDITIDYELLESELTKMLE